MFILKKFLFILELEVGAFIIGMLGFTTSFLLELFIVLLLYQTDCLGLFKLYACATLVAYYMIASFMLVKEIFCDRRPSFVKHFLVIDIIVTCIIISGSLKVYTFYPTWWPLFLTDSLIRLYSNLCTYSLLVKYKNSSNEKTDKSTPSLSASKSTSSTSTAVNEGVMKIFDNFCGFFQLELAGFIYCGLNFLFSIIFLVLLLVLEELDEEEIAIIAVIFILNFAMLITLAVSIKMRKSSILVPFLIFTFLEILFAIYLLVSSMIVIHDNEEYEHRMQRFIEKINIPETTGIGIWIYFFLCLCSLYDVLKCEENGKKQLNAKESITYGSVDETKGSSSL